MLERVKQRRAELEKALVLAKQSREKAMAMMQAAIAQVDKIEGALAEVKRFEGYVKDALPPVVVDHKIEAVA